MTEKHSRLQQQSYSHCGFNGIQIYDLCDTGARLAAYWWDSSDKCREAFDVSGQTARKIKSGFALKTKELAHKIGHDMQAKEGTNTPLRFVRHKLTF